MPKKPRSKFSRRFLQVRLLLYTVFIIWGGFSGCQMIKMPGTSYRGALPALSDDQSRLSIELKKHVITLADHIGARNVNMFPKKLFAAENYITGEFEQYGYKVLKNGFKYSNMTVNNLIVELKGTEKPDEIIVIGAHYDSANSSPGANDNASGVAAVLCLAKQYADKPFKRTVRFVAFVNEEPPFFQTALMGSLVYARQCRADGDNVVGMISFDGIGYYSDEKDTQHYPFPLNAFYPSEGNFIGFVGNQTYDQFVKKGIKLFRDNAKFPSEGAALPGAVQGVGWSDHWSFWQCEYPAFMITDSLPFRYEHYHTTDDTGDKVDFGRMARVVEGSGQVIKGLANE